MNRNEFEKLYVNKNRFNLTHSQIEVTDQMRIDWDSFDHLRNSSDLDCILRRPTAAGAVTNGS